jgi:predicted AAA+ superfamily ATPase
MTAFHTIAIPHDDILQGRLTMDVFAADLWEVFKGRGVEEYRNPDLFFQKTYETEGLKTLLDVVEKRLKGKGGDPVLQIQTPFGGGKTHTLIAMYHKAKDWDAKRVVMVGTKMAARDTLWGMLEEQLTGKSKRFKEMVSPGGTDEFRDMLVNAGPTLILMDELLEYLTKAAGVTVGESNLADQTIAFMQELTETVSSLGNVVLVVTLPSSNMPNMNEKAQKLLQNMQYVSGRMEKIYTPVQEHEITSVIRLRLFSKIDNKKASKVINQFVEYATQESLLPAGTEASEYRTRFEASYPFLPEVVDVLYQRWGSYYTFQRTRGALRLLALVIFGLKDSNIPYITLANFDLANQEVRRELLKHIGAEFDSVIAADITGADSGALKVNANLGKAYQGLRLGERVATTVFMYSFSGGMERGVTVIEIKRNATTMENPSATVAEAVEELKGRLSSYIQYQAGKYFFSNQANLNHLLLVRMENIAETEIKSQEERLLRENVRSDKLKAYIWRTESADIPDTPDLKLIVLPENNPVAIKSLLEEKGGSPRVHRNTMFFLVPMPSERSAFGNLIRRFLAYQALQSDITLKLTAEQNSEIKSNQKRLEGDLAEGLRRLYRQIYLPARSGVKESDLGVPTSGYSGFIDQEVYERLRSDGEILEKMYHLTKLGQAR